MVHIQLETSHHLFESSTRVGDNRKADVTTHRAGAMWLNHVTSFQWLVAADHIYNMPFGPLHVGPNDVAR